MIVSSLKKRLMIDHPFIGKNLNGIKIAKTKIVK